MMLKDTWMSQLGLICNDLETACNLISGTPMCTLPTAVEKCGADWITKYVFMLELSRKKTEL